MAESVLLSMLVEVAKPMVTVMVNRAMEEFRYAAHFKRELKDLQDKIQIIAGIVDGMTAVRNTPVELWLKNAVRIVRDAGDVMDVLAYEKQRRAVMKRKLVFLESVYLHAKMGHWIRKINSDIDAIVKQAQLINELKALVDSPSFWQSVARIFVNHRFRPNVDTSLFDGRDSVVDTVVDMLRFNIHPKHLSVVAIVGIRGLEKTTLAKQVYNNERVKHHFINRIWIPEVKEFDIEGILNKMVEFLGKGRYEDASRETSIRKLEKHLGGKRYLLVLDDVWNVDKKLWRSMKNALEEIGGSKDSMVLTTTRDYAVVKTMHATSSVYRFPGLSEDNSWSLFEKIIHRKESIF